MKLLVSFETTGIDGSHDDTMKIVAQGGFERDIPMFAYPPQPQLIFEPFINLGFCKVNTLKRDKILFKNEGKQQAKVDLKINDLEII